MTPNFDKLLTDYDILDKAERGPDRVNAMLGWAKAASAALTSHHLSVFDLCHHENRHPTREEAREAARVLRLCNGHDLTTWGADGLIDDGAQEALAALCSYRTPTP